MFVLHVSKFEAPMDVTRVVIGCKHRAEKIAVLLSAVGYNVWETEEDTVVRTVKEEEAALELMRELAG